MTGNQKNVALLIVDMQNCFLDPLKGSGEFDNACEHINYVAGLLRKSGHHVIHIQDVEGAGERTEEELDFIPEIEFIQGDKKISKTASNAFWETGLDKLLHELGTGMVIVCGFTAEQCVLFTYNGAIERGYKTVMLQNGILSRRPENIIHTYMNRNTISYPVIEFLMGK